MGKQDAKLTKSVKEEKASVKSILSESLFSLRYFITPVFTTFFLIKELISNICSGLSNSGNSIIDAINSTINNPVILLLLLLGIFLLIFAVLIIRNQRQSRVVKFNRLNNGCFRILKGSFDNNVIKLINENSSDIKKYIFAIGLDLSCELDQATTGGTLRALMGLLKKRYSISVEDMQSEIDIEKKKLEEREKRSVQLGDILIVTYHIDKNSPFELNLNVIFIVNSKKKNISFIEDKNDILGEDSSHMIHKIFDCFYPTPSKEARGSAYISDYNRDRVKELEVTTLVTAALGTNRLNYPYTIIFSQIVNQYVYIRLSKIRKEDKSDFNVVFSVREEDLVKHKISISQLINYLNHCKHYYSNNSKKASLLDNI